MSRPTSLDMLRSPVEEELKRRVGKVRLPLYDMVRYHLGWIDDMRAPQPLATPDRVFGALCLLSAEAIGGSSPQDMLAGAAAAELFAAFVEVQDDLIIGTPDRDKRPALWWVFGHSQGINAADGMYSLARVALMDSSERSVAPDRVLEAMRIMDEACLKLCEARFTIMNLQQRDQLTVDAYLEKMTSECGGVVGVALAIGAGLAGADAPRVSVLGEAGTALGAAWRIRKELDLFSPDNSASQVLEALDKGGSLLLLHARQQGIADSKHLIDNLASRTVPVEDKHLAQLRDALRASGTFAFAQDALDARLNKALLLLAKAYPWGTDGSVAALGRYLVEGNQD